MKISIITIVYNNRPCIAECINSVLSQDYPDIEYIVIDGGSTDGTVDIIRQYADKIACFHTGKDKGLYDALNKGIEKATGDYIGILHSDDLFYAPDTVSKVVAELSRTSADVLYANGMYVDRENPGHVKRIYPAKPYRSSYLYFGWIPLHTTIYVRKDLFHKLGMYDLRYSIASDYEISLRWFKDATVKKVFLNEWVVRMRLGGKSTTARLQKKKSTEDLQIIREHGLLGYFTLFCKIGRKIPQYIMPKLRKY